MTAIEGFRASCSAGRRRRLIWLFPRRSRQFCCWPAAWHCSATPNDPWPTRFDAYARHGITPRAARQTLPACAAAPARDAARPARDGGPRQVAAALRTRDLKDDAAPASDYWALRDISVEVAAGEIFGLAGHNGSGKSTLLKIVARITEPSAGRALVRGRVAHPGNRHRLSHGAERPREHLSQRSDPRHAAGEIRANFDAIVAMSGIEPFLEMPVKRYSSGMYLRLAFSVAAHLESEILLLDEVLAVGDEAFQQTCRNKILELAQAGRAIVVVSHDTNLLRRLCGRVMLLESGRIQAIGKARCSRRAGRGLTTGPRLAGSAFRCHHCQHARSRCGLPFRREAPAPYSALTHLTQPVTVRPLGWPAQTYRAATTALRPRNNIYARAIFERQHGQGVAHGAAARPGPERAWHVVETI